MALSVAIKGGGFVVSLVLVRIYVDFFKSSAVLGVWFTLLSLLNWILTFDFGTGNGLRNRLVQAIAEGNESEQKALISTTYAMSAAIGAVAFTVACAAAFLVDWNSFFNVGRQQIAPDILRNSILIVAAGICLQLVLNTVNSILYALQKPSIANATGLLTNLMLLLIMLVIRPSSDGPGMLVLAWAYLFCSTLPFLLASLWLFGGQLRHASPSVGAVGRDAGRRILRLGLGFFVLQLLSLVLFNSKEVIITRLILPDYVVQYQFYNRIYNSVASLAWIALIPMWSAISEAYYSGDYEWIRGAYRQLSKYMLVFVLALVGLTISLQVIFNVWLGRHGIAVNYWYACTFALYYALYVWWGVLASFANGTGKIRPQLVWSSVGAALYLAIGIGGSLLTGNWIATVWAGIVGMLGYCAVEPRNIVRLTEGMKRAQDVTP
jgi:O-antigen/teichoic acid export membrane protein